ncbi:uncharacterized protein LOC122274612 [Carya illinoinensis]|uniref:uncharacterized protein LOC122274612 n=1 Tax=Carya illinoinensis TaxID=32201 RepID=UPI001C726A39|nr:uncharacterized protein LOC122274612 [Carya illinoinensis]
MHVLWTCPAANDIWAEPESLVHKWSRKEEDFMGLWERMMQNLNKNQMEEVVMILRRVWWRRNTFVFEKKMLCPKGVIRAAKEALLEYQNAQAPQTLEIQVQRPAREKQKWKKPVGGFVKVNWDAALVKKKEKMGVGIVIRDEVGDPMVAVCDQQSHVEDPMVAECLALCKALELCIDLNIRQAIFEGDAQTVIMAVNREEEDMSCIGSVIEDVKVLFKQNTDWKLQFTHRENNIVAHTLARNALGLLEQKVWIEDMPAFIVKELESDKLYRRVIH